MTRPLFFEYQSLRVHLYHHFMFINYCGLKQLTINEELNSNTPHSSGNDFAKIESILSSAKSQIKTTKKNHTNRLWLKR